jgi:hypothetical protein
MESLTAAARRLYVLTEGGQVRGATYDRENADAWLNLGEEFDYIPVVPEDVPEPEEASPTSARQAPAKAQTQTQDITTQQDALRKRLEKMRKKFAPQSPLLQPED